jgi:hypothetical protein
MADDKLKEYAQKQTKAVLASLEGILALSDDERKLALGFSPPADFIESLRAEAERHLARSEADYETEDDTSK